MKILINSIVILNLKQNVPQCFFRYEHPEK